MIRVGFLGRTRLLYDTIRLFEGSDQFSTSFIWTCKDEDYYNFEWRNFEEIARELDCPFVNSPTIDSNKGDVHADIVISVNFINIISKQFLAKFRYGILNAHAGDLPRYKGNACPNWAILNSEESVTLSIHKMDEGLDSGPVVSKGDFTLGEHTYIGEVYDWLEASTPALFLDAASKLRQGLIPENQVGRTLRTFPRKPEDARLDFSKDIHWNYRLIRASSRPFDGAFAFLNGSDSKVTIYEARPRKVDYDFCAVSGQIMERFRDKSSFLLAIGDGVLEVTDFSVDGLTSEESYPIVCRSLRNRLS